MTLSANISQYLYLLSSLMFLVVGIFFYTRTKHHGCIVIIIGAILSAIADVSFSINELLEENAMFLLSIADLMSYIGPLGLLLVSLGIFLLLNTYTRQ